MPSPTSNTPTIKRTYYQVFSDQFGGFITLETFEDAVNELDEDQTESDIGTIEMTEEEWRAMPETD